MRWTAVAPVTWPSDQGFDAWWRAMVVEELAGSGDQVGLFDRDGEQVRLISGEHLQPGAVYRWVPPEGFSLGGAAYGIGGPPDARELFLEYQEGADAGRRVTVVVDSLDDCRSLTATSSLKHLMAQASFRPERDRLLDVEVKLDWLLVRVRGRVVPAAVGEQLRVSLRVVGRGLWKPVIAPLLVPVGIALSHLLAEETEEAADRLTHLDDDPRGDGAPERELERIRAGAELIRARLHEVVSTVDARSWWTGRRAAHLRAAFDALPAVGPDWPPVTPAVAFGGTGRWWDEEQWIFDRFLEASPWRRKRADEVDRQVDGWLRQQEQMVTHRTLAQAELAAAEDPLGDLTGRTGAELNAMLDLSWLATPWSTVRFLVRQASRDGMDDDLPDLATDADARRFVTDLLKDV
ncbi:hypothetical protein [Ornithinimicrobium cryptoxanthini]|uniref:hypothetical protein n=1 Tax=Ornithinimicrobium cryptoxanthini TaxID=2934161 RepID=UPI0021192B9C|nr:hypothetical protein [Ornithinimicrobium cryptoxanthini]